MVYVYFHNGEIVVEFKILIFFTVKRLDKQDYHKTHSLPVPLGTSTTNSDIPTILICSELTNWFRQAA